MSKAIVVLTIFAVFVNLAFGAGCHGNADFGTPNNLPIQEGTSFMTLIGSVPNGLAYSVQVKDEGGNTTSNYTLLHVFGTPYQMGFAQGTLLKDKVSRLISTVWTYLEGQVENALPNYFPKWFDDLIADVGLDVALDLTEAATADFTGEYIFEEIRGLSDASGADYDTIVRIHMIAGLTQGDCSMFGAWGPALDPTSSCKLLQLRALDWNMDGPFRDYSQITVYHPNADNGHGFVNIGFSGFIGGLTGMSATQLGISEIGVAYPDASFGEESRIGVPFIFLLRAILQFDSTLEKSLDRMKNAWRTCNLLFGVGDGKSSEFAGIQYSYSVCNVFNDTDLMPFNQTWHPRIPGVVYWGMDWECPSYNTVLSELIMKWHGKITPEIAISDISAVEKSGDNHLAFYDLTGMNLYVSFAAPTWAGGALAAYSRQFTKWDVTALLNTPAPTF